MLVYFALSGLCNHILIRMNLIDISFLRLVNQQIVGSKCRTAKEIVAWMGAMQAQDYAMVKWAMGVRLPDTTEKAIDSAIDKGEIIRTHLLRPTWHFVSADDIYWMLNLTAPHIKTTTKSRDNELGLSEIIFQKSNSIFAKALSGNKQLSREELISELEKASIATDENRAYHLFMRAELDGIMCSGRNANTRTYALLSERVPQPKPITRDEALARLAERYFTSHCPATLQDFVWWSGLPVRDAKHALEMIKPKFVTETIGTQAYLLTNSFSVPKFDKDLIHLLPAYDEFLISYRDRAASLPFSEHNKVVSNNGLFRPIVVLNSQVTGVWKRTTRKNTILIEPTYFQPLSNETKKRIVQEFSQLERFLGKKVEVI